MYQKLYLYLSVFVCQKNWLNVKWCLFLFHKTKCIENRGYGIQLAWQRLTILLVYGPFQTKEMQPNRFWRIWIIIWSLSDFYVMTGLLSLIKRYYLGLNIKYDRGLGIKYDLCSYSVLELHIDQSKHYLL